MKMKLLTALWNIHLIRKWSKVHPSLPVYNTYKGTGSSNSPALQPHPLKITMVYIIQHWSDIAGKLTVCSSWVAIFYVRSCEDLCQQTELLLVHTGSVHVELFGRTRKCPCAFHTTCDSARAEMAVTLAQAEITERRLRPLYGEESDE